MLIIVGPSMSGLDDNDPFTPGDIPEMQIRRRMRLAGAASAGIFLAAIAAAAGAAEGKIAAPEKSNSGGPRPLDLTVVIDGPPIAITPKENGRLVRLNFVATAGQRVGLGITGVRMSPASASALVVSVRGPKDEAVTTERIHCFAASATNPDGNCDGEVSITSSGKHTLEIDAPFSAAATYTAHLTAPVSGRLQAGQTQELSLRRIGQDARLALTVEAGADVAVEARTAAAGSGGAFRLKVFRPDGTLLAAAEGGPQRGASVPVSGAPGVYTVELDPVNGATGTFALTARGAAGLALGAAPVAFNTSDPSEVVRLTLGARAGQTFTVAIDNLAFTPEVDSNSVLSVTDEAGTRLAGLGCRTRPIEGLKYLAPCKVVVRTPPSSGRYTVVITPPMRASMSGRAMATEVVSGALATDAPVAIAALKQGQVARYTFNAAAGEVVGLELSNVTIDPASSSVSLRLERPDGAVMGTMGLFNGIARMEPAALPASGTYAVWIDPGLGAIGAGKLSLVTGGVAK